MSGINAAMCRSPGRGPVGDVVLFAPLVLALLLGACASPSQRGPAYGVGSGTYKVGSPYQVNGIWYYPAEDYSYDETGIASWYGPGFHKERTANGEVFDQNAISAAHKTLPMPSLVRVTNLDNGHSIVVRINDRGPFVNGRIIDMSWRCAQLLGFDRGGTAKVRVQILAEESRAIAVAARSNAPVAAHPAAYGEEAGAAVVAAPTKPIAVETLPPRSPAGTTVAEPVPAVTAPGHFLPAPEVAQRPADSSHQIYVQAGAFTEYNHASRLRDKVAAIAPATISQTLVGQTEFFRVRLGPIESVEKADGILSQVVGVGSTDARLVID